MKSKNEDLLKEFAEFCNIHPEYRFWQALSAWSEADCLWWAKNNNMFDTFYWENKNHKKKWQKNQLKSQNQNQENESKNVQNVNSSVISE